MRIVFVNRYEINAKINSSILIFALDCKQGNKVWVYDTTTLTPLACLTRIQQIIIYIFKSTPNFFKGITKTTWMGGTSDKKRINRYYKTTSTKLTTHKQVRKIIINFQFSTWCFFGSLLTFVVFHFKNFNSKSYRKVVVGDLKV